MTNRNLTETSAAFQPTEAQKARALALKRFNQMSVYIPLVAIGLLLLVFAGIMFQRTVFASEGVAQPLRQRLSALSDLIIIMSCLPVLFACFILPAAGVGLMVYDRGREYTRIHAMQRLFWRLDKYIDMAQDKIEEIGPKIAQPIIKLNAIIASIRARIYYVWQILFG